MHSELSSLIPLLVEPATEVQLEALEWGKYCNSPDGPVVDGAEHRSLGATPGYPQILRSVSQPDDLGISCGQFEEEAQRLFEKIPYGTALRIVAMEGSHFQVLYRVGVRSEAGTLRAHRRKYSLARYLVDPSGKASPLALYKNMSPLRGLTREMAMALQPVLSASLLQERQYLVGAPFLEQALTYVISGVPVQVFAGETEFFRSVDELWHALPSDLRPFLNAGWNVSAAVASELAVFSSPVHSESAATYSGGKWTPPAASAVTLVSGETYAHCFFKSAAHAPEHLVEKWLDSKSSLNLDEELNAVPSYADKGVAVRFRKAGILLLENGAMECTRSWLVKGIPDLSGKLSSLAEKLGQRRDLQELIDDGFNSSDASQRRRADELFLALYRQPKLRGDAPRLLGRGAVLQAAQRRDSSTILNSLLEAGAQEIDDLPEETVRTILELLPQTLDQVAIHFKLLHEHAAEKIYSRWAREHIVDLAIRFAGDPAIAQSGLARLQDLCAAGDTARPLVAVLAKLVSGGRRTQDDRAVLSAMPCDFMSAFCELLETLWKQHGVRNVDRDILLNWCTGLSTDKFSHPAFKLATGRNIDRTETAYLALSVAELPESLWPSLSEAALHAFLDLKTSILQNPQSWGPLIALWPQSTALTLLGTALQNFQRIETGRTVEFKTRFTPPAVLIQDLIEYWLVEPRPEKLKLVLDAAPVIWEWIDQLEPPEHPRLQATEICWCLAKRGFIPGSEPDKGAFSHENLAMELARLSGEYDSLTKRTQALWNSAATGWQIKLMLELFPQVEFIPSSSQLVALLPLRNWLRGHLHRPDTASSRDHHFQIATASFQELRFPGTGDKRWRAEWEGTALAAGYKNAPLKLPPLETVFEFYASTPAERAQICIQYLNAAQGNDSEHVLQGIVEEFLFPAALNARLSKKEVVGILRAVQHPKANGVEIAASDTADPIQWRGGETIAIASYLIPLLWLIVNRGHASWVQKFVDKRYDQRSSEGVSFGRRGKT